MASRGCTGPLSIQLCRIRLLRAYGSPGQGIAVYPFLWSAEAHQDLAATTRRPPPMRELLGMHSEFHSQLAGDAPGFLGGIPLPIASVRDTGYSQAYGFE